MTTNNDSASTGLSKPPFQSLSFSLTDKAIGRRVFRMKYQAETDDYHLHVESGISAESSEEFERTLSRRNADDLYQVLRDIDAFNWEAEYGDSTYPGSRRWNIYIVFQEDVFSVQSLGGSDVPAGFDTLLEAFYSLDLPRPATSAPGMAGAQGLSGSAGVPDLSSLFGAAGVPGGPDPFAIEQMQEAFAEMQRNPEGFAQQMREEFRHLPREQQDMMLDMLASSGMATREWWERFFRG